VRVCAWRPADASRPVVLGRADDLEGIGALCVLGLLGLRTASHDRAYGRVHRPRRAGRSRCPPARRPGP